jgi:hypothetical protein
MLLAILKSERSGTISAIVTTGKEVKFRITDFFPVSGFRTNR